MPIILYNDICRIEKNITRDAKERKDEKKQKLTEREQNFTYVEERIKKEYPDGITDDKLKKSFSKIVPMICNTCNEYKILPYDFISEGVRKKDAINCKTCVSILCKSSRKCKGEMNTLCECGMIYYGSENNTYIHLASSSHIKRMKLVINGKYYKRSELIELSKQYKIPYYKKLNNDEIVDILKKLMV